jgi:hypothetical protein
MLLHLPVAFTVLLSLATAVVANPFDVDWLRGIETRDTDRKCGSHRPPETVSKQEKAFNSLLAENNATLMAIDAPATYTILVTFHVIYAGITLSKGYVP